MNTQHIRRGAVILLGGLTLALVLILPSLLRPITSAAAPLLQATLTPSAYVYLPLVVKEYAPTTPTPTPTSPTPMATPTPTNTSQPTPVAGAWAGTTSRGHPMSFDVLPGSTQWASFTLETDFTAPSCGVSSGTLTQTVNGPGSISNNQFGYSSSTYSFTGQFTSATTASGTYAFNNFQIVIGVPYPPYVCFYYLTQSGTWSANRP